MSKRSYILLRARKGRAELAAKILSDMPGIIVADAVDGGPPDIVVTVEAEDGPNGAKQAIQALQQVEAMSQFMYWLPARQ